jgi:hypothetical protein
MAATPMTVVETAEFLKHAARLMPCEEREKLVAFVGSNPEAGEIIPETGGVRKIRWAREGMGKRGGARVIYYYHTTRDCLCFCSPRTPRTGRRISATLSVEP